jgi:D-glycero-alpha-D-manno-heptose-7-phosphate kinase
MIISRSPLRISLGGGGTDLPSYYKDNEGFVISAAIDKYVYASVLRPFKPGIFLKYSSIENVQKVSQIKHNILRETLRMFNLNTPQIEITTLADIPAGTGLGSSSSFTTALIKALYTHYKKSINASELAELACKIEIEKLKEPIGKQDQYISAIGGLTTFDFKKDGSVVVKPLNISIETLQKLEDNLLLFYTGISRSASLILEDQNLKTLDLDNKMIENLDKIKNIGFRSKIALEKGDLNHYCELLIEHWDLKQSRSNSISNTEINQYYNLGLKNGALGGKLVGAGGGGFLIFYVEDKSKLRNAMKKIGLEEVRFRFDFEGTKVMLS